jgi:hypothetical protein
LIAFDAEFDCNSVYTEYFGGIQCSKYSGTLPDGTVVKNAILGVV